MLKLNGNLIEATKFPDKTHQVWKLVEGTIDMGGENIIYWEYEHDGEILQLRQLVDLVRTSIESRFAKIQLIMPYLPYGRQDKEVSNNQTFGLYSFAKILNDMSLTRVESYDTHSLVAGRLIERFRNIPATAEILYAARNVKAKSILFPDKGARDRYAEIFQKRVAEDQVKVYHAEKLRDSESGEILHVGLIGTDEFDFHIESPILIVDDICDGGRTFTGLANLIRKHNPAAEIHLYVTHGIFSKGLEVLRAAGITRIFTWKGEVR